SCRPPRRTCRHQQRRRPTQRPALRRLRTRTAASPTPRRRERGRTPRRGRFRNRGRSGRRDAVMHDHVALVTGAGRARGRAIALRRAAAGCRVAALARTASELEETIRASDAGSQPILAVATDITRDADLEAAVHLIIERLGRITILINNAGFAPPRASL